MSQWDGALGLWSAGAVVLRGRVWATRPPVLVNGTSEAPVSPTIMPPVARRRRQRLCRRL